MQGRRGNPEVGKDAVKLLGGRELQLPEDKSAAHTLSGAPGVSQIDSQLRHQAGAIAFSRAVEFFDGRSDLFLVATQQANRSVDQDMQILIRSGP